MMYAFTQDVPIDAAFYRRIAEGLGPDSPPGLLVHLAIERPGDGLRYIDVWEDEASAERFTEERLHPVVHQLLHEVFGDQLPPEPERVPLTVVHASTRRQPCVIRARCEHRREQRVLATVDTHVRDVVVGDVP